MEYLVEAIHNIMFISSMEFFHLNIHLSVHTAFCVPLCSLCVPPSVCLSVHTAFCVPPQKGQLESVVHLYGCQCPFIILYLVLILAKL